MASNYFTLFLFSIFLLLSCSTPRISSYEDETKIEVNYPSSLISLASPVEAPLPAAPTSPPPTVEAPTTAPAPAPSPIVKPKKDCTPLCENRCKLHSRKRVCMRACGTCCERCKCVPPGTSGNREKCGKCYTDMITHGNRHKCP